MIDIIQDLEDTLKEHPDRLYLCTNEVGHEERGILVRFADDTHEFFNPAFQKREKPFINRERDILTGDEYLVPRFASVEIVYQDCLGSVKANLLNEGASVVMCQAMDLLNGITSKDYGLPILEGFDDLTDEEKGEIISDYLGRSQEMYNEFDKELEDNSETRQIWNAAKFIKRFAEGKVKTEPRPQSNREKKRLKNLIKSIKQQTNKTKFWRKK